VLKAAAEKLIHESHACGAHVQAGVSAQGAGGGVRRPGREGSRGDVVDAEYEDPAKK